MKKIIFVFILFVCTNLSVFATETPIDVIYLHGTNQDTIGGADAFKVWMNKMHPYLIKNFSENEFVNSHSFSNAYIKQEPDMLYWCNSAISENRAILLESLEKSRVKTKFIHQYIRYQVAMQVHDANWVQKNKHKYPILEDLHKKVMTNYKNGEKTMLVGYSAGTFLALDYMVTRFKSFSPADVLEFYKKDYNISDKEIEFTKTYYPQNTCISEGLKSNFFTVDVYGYYGLNSNKQEREKALKHIKNNTNLNCTPDDAVVGTLNIGSPILLYKSDMFMDKTIQGCLAKKMLEHIVENNKFYLTVNYSHDPIAMPMPDITFEMLSKYKYTQNIKNGNGFIYDASISGSVLSTNPHWSYWKTANKYTKEVAKSYQKGYNHFYSKN